MDEAWKRYYPWNPTRDIYKNEDVQTITQNARITHCVFSNILNSQAFYVNLPIFILLDHCTITKCTRGNSGNAVVDILMNSGSCTLENVLIEECSNPQETGYILIIGGNSDNAGTIKLNQVTSHNNEAKIHPNGYINQNIYLNNDYQEAKNCNVSGNTIDSFAIGFNHATNAVAEWLLVISNTVETRPVYMNYKGVIRQSNLVNNSENYGSEYYGLISTVDEGTFVVVESCYIMGNKCKALSSTTSGTIIYVNCCIDDKTKNDRIQIKNPVEFGQLEWPNSFCSPCRSKMNLRLGLSGIFLMIIK